MLQGIQALEICLAQQHSVDVVSGACCTLRHTHAVVRKQCLEDVQGRKHCFELHGVYPISACCIYLHPDEIGNQAIWRFTEL